MNRVDLLNEIYAGRARLESALNRIPDERMTEPALTAERSVKDLLAHIGFWENRAVEIYREVSGGRTPAYPIDDAAVDAINAQVLEEMRPRGLDEVRAFERQAFRKLLEVVETAPEGDLFDPERFAFTDGRPFYLWIAWNGHEHYDEHTAELLRVVEASAGALHPVVRAGGAFLENAGRNIDRAVFDYAFRGLPAEEVLDVLARYQTKEGGITGLEVDIKGPSPDPFAAELAVRILTFIDPPRDHPVVTRLVEYLETTQDEDGCWRFAPEVYQGSLAPWFQNWQWPNLNPSGQIAGQLKRLGLGSDRLHARVQRLFERLSRPADVAGGSTFYDILPYALYYQTEWNFPLAELYRWGVVWWLVGQSVRPVGGATGSGEGGIDATHFIELAPRPGLAVARRLPAEILSERLDALLADQQPDGGWSSPYSPEWRPWITVSNLLALKAYGMIG